MTNYVYHIMPKNLIGTTLYPLDFLIDIDKDLYSKYISKYDNRESIKNRVIPYLNVKWTNVVFFFLLLTLT